MKRCFQQRDLYNRIKLAHKRRKQVINKYGLVDKEKGKRNVSIWRAIMMMPIRTGIER